MWIKRPQYEELLKEAGKVPLLVQQSEAMMKLATMTEKRLVEQNEKLAQALLAAKARIKKLEGLIIKLKDEVEAKTRMANSQLQPVTIDEALFDEDEDQVQEMRRLYAETGSFDGFLAAEAQTDGGV